MFQTLLLECERLQLNQQWMRTLERLLGQFESFWNDKPRSGELHDDCSSTKHILDRPSFAILDALRQLRESDDEELRKVLISRAISRLPIFRVRVKSEGGASPTFWDPLGEHLSLFIKRAEDQHHRLRYYTSETPLHGEDVIQTRVFDMLSVTP